MKVPYFSVGPDAPEEVVDEIMARLTAERVACCNWSGEFPYSPEVTVRMFHSGDRLFVRYDVTEDCVAARVAEDNGRVWCDSCVELFLSLDGEAYYNIEATCIGRVLVGYRRPGVEAVHARQEVMAGIGRRASLGSETFEERVGRQSWSLTLELPVGVLFCDDVKSWEGLEARGNIYKCGDELSKPHFLSWKPIDHPTPCFHLPAFFGEMNFVSE